MIEGLPVELPVIVWDPELLGEAVEEIVTLTDPELETLPVALPDTVWEVEADPVTV